jgi:Tfp pilus assembly protein PilF
MNNYSYYLSLRKDSLMKAEKMSRLSLQIDPNNSSYQDTYGWILYQQEKYEEAKIWIERAIQNGEVSGVVLEHYGDVLYKLNQRDLALEYWHKAKVAGNGSEFLNKKIEDQKLYE